jgi:hypothetical protein
MASIAEHLGIIEGQIECLESQGHIQQPEEHWAIQKLREAAEKMRRTFVNNGRDMDRG